jgi:lysophospholipase L1-like esterase
MRHTMTSTLAILLASCGGSSGPAPNVTAPVGTAPAPTPTPTPAPAPTPTASSSPSPSTPQAVPDGKIIVASEGDSISVLGSWSHTGIYRASRPDIEFHGQAVGGSGVYHLQQRLPALLALKPDVVTVFIGANDLLDYSGPQAYADLLRSYVGAIKATGAKVVVATNLPQTNVNVDYASRFNRSRAELATILRSAPWVDGVIDFAADPVMGSDAAAGDKALFGDGVHPTDEGQKKLAAIYKPRVDPLVRDWR